MVLPGAGRSMCSDDGELPTPEEIAEVTGGDADKIRNGMRAFEWVDQQDNSAPQNIGSDCGGCVDIRAQSRDYSGRRWFWFLQVPESQEGSEE